MSTVVVRSAWVGAGGTVTTPSAPPLTGQAGTLITVLDFCFAAAGWTKVMSGTNAAAYQAPLGNRCVFSVDDSTAQWARVSGFERITTDALTGVGEFPRTDQFAGGLYLNKSLTADTTQRPYVFWANQMAMNFTVSINAFNQWNFFGDYPSMKYGGEAFGNTAIVANNLGAPANSQVVGMWGSATGAQAAIPAHFCARPVGGVGSSVPFGMVSDYMRSRGFSSYELGSMGVPYPGIVEGGLVLSRIFICDPTHGPRGWFPGVCVPCHSPAIGVQGDTVTCNYGSEFAGKSLELLGAAYDGRFYMETSDTWEY